MRQRGVTLMEILVAISVLSVGLLTVFELFPMGFAASAKGRFKTKATQLAQRLVEEARVSANPRSFSTVASTAQFETAASFRAFADEPEYWYRVHCESVIDPSEKYVEFYTTSKDLTSLWRFTITVRGPMNPSSVWYTVPIGRRKAIEVQIGTYIADKRVTQTTPQTGRNIAVADTVVYVNDIRPFTVFNLNNLTNEEVNDTGPIKYKLYDPQSGTKLYSQRNDMQLDNIEIIYSAVTTGDVTTLFSDKIIDNKETNKIIDKVPDAGYSLPSASAVPGRLVLLHPVRGMQVSNNATDPTAAENYTTYAATQTTIRPYIVIK